VGLWCALELLLWKFTDAPAVWLGMSEVAESTPISYGVHVRMQWVCIHHIYDELMVETHERQLLQLYTIWGICAIVAAQSAMSESS
jgi:hypothetical protein